MNLTSVVRAVSPVIGRMFFVVLAVLLVMAVPVAADDYFPTGGTGVAGSPFEIASAYDLWNLSNLTNTGATYESEGTKNYNTSHYLITAAEIDLNDLVTYGIQQDYWTGTGWNPIGNTTDFSFRGTFDGNNKTIKNLTINTTANYAGLFGVTFSSVIRNMALSEVNVTGGSYVGGLAGWARNRDTISSSFVTGSINGNQYVGGLVGRMTDGSSIANSYATGNVTGSSSYVGGLAGSMEDTGSNIVNSYAASNVTARSSAGGLVGGVISFTGTISIINSYAVGNVKSTSDSGGGLVGYVMNAGNIVNSTALNEYVDGGDSLLTARVGPVPSSNFPTYNDNYAWDGMAALRAAFQGLFSTNQKDGGNITSEEVWDTFSGSEPNSKPWTNFSTDIWEPGTADDYKLPVLIGLTEPNFDARYLKPVPVQYFPDGDGSEGDPFRILTAYDLWNLSYLTNTGATYTYDGGTKSYNSSHYLVEADIDLNDLVPSPQPDYWTGTGWNPIGNYSTTSVIFNGSFDGGGRTIENLYINNSSAKNLGLFGVADKGSTFSNVTLMNVNITGDSFIGGLVGNMSGNIINSSTSGNVKTSYSSIGGLVGWGAKTSSIINSSSSVNVSGSNSGGLVGNMSGNIAGSSASGNVAGSRFVGGLVGRLHGIISDSFATGNVTGSIMQIGGLVGDQSDFSSRIINSYATGNVTGKTVSTAMVGGLVGGGASYGALSDSYATGNVTGGYNVGGLVGHMQVGYIISNSYATGDVTGGRSVDTGGVGGLVGYAYNGINTISNSFATGNVTGSGNNYVGGFIGSVSNTNISNSYATGNVTGDNGVGGFVGRTSGNIENSSALNQYVNGNTNVGRFAGTESGSIVNSYAWYGTQGNTDFPDLLTGVENTTSMKVWNKTTTPWTEQPWNNFTGIWELNSSQPDRYLLPTLMDITDYDKLPDVTYLMPADFTVDTPHILNSGTDFLNITFKVDNGTLPVLSAGINVTNASVSHYLEAVYDGAGNFTGNVTGLTENTLYTITVNATNTQLSYLENETTYTTNSPAESPTVDTPVEVDKTQTSLNVTFKVTNGTGTISNAVLNVSNATWFDNTIQPTLLPDGNYSAEITGLSPDTLYTVSLNVTNSHGLSAENSGEFTTTAADPIVDETPTVETPATSDITQTSVNVTFGFTNGTAPANAVLNISNATWSDNMIPLTLSGDGLNYSAEITGLAPGTSYDVVVNVTNIHGSALSSTSFTTLSEDAFTVSIDGISTGTTTASVTYSYVSAETIASGTVSYYSVSNPSDITEVTLADLSGTVQLTGLRSSTAYEVWVNLTADSGAVGTSAVSSFTTNAVYYESGADDGKELLEQHGNPTATAATTQPTVLPTSATLQPTTTQPDTTETSVNPSATSTVEVTAAQTSDAGGFSLNDMALPLGILVIILIGGIIIYVVIQNRKE